MVDFLEVVGFEPGLKEGFRKTRKVERGHARHVDHMSAIA